MSDKRVFECIKCGHQWQEVSCLEGGKHGYEIACPQCGSKEKYKVEESKKIACGGEHMHSHGDGHHCCCGKH